MKRSQSLREESHLSHQSVMLVTHSNQRADRTPCELGHMTRFFCTKCPDNTVHSSM